MSISKLVILGGEKEFNERKFCGQLNFPEWEDYIASMRGIFEREYYTNNGPLVRELERKLSYFHNTKNIITVTNKSIAFLIALEVLNIKSKIIISPFSELDLTLSILRAGAKPVYCDINYKTLHIDECLLSDFNKEDFSAIIALNSFGDCANINKINNWAIKANKTILWDSSKSNGSKFNNKILGANGSLEIFSMDSGNIINCFDGAYITTNDDHLAEKMRNIRSSYGVQKVIKVDRTVNGRLSEFQAAIALSTLKNFENYKCRNQEQRKIYLENLKNIIGIKMQKTYSCSNTNNQDLIIRIDEKEFGLKKNIFIDLLKMENVFTKNPLKDFEFIKDKLIKNNNLTDLRNTNLLTQEILQLPIGSSVNKFDIERICLLIRNIQLNSEVIRRKYYNY